MKWKSIRSKLPSKVKVGPGVHYDVLFSTDLKDALGITDFNKKQIIVLTGQTDRQTVLTLFHEYLHALGDAHNVGLSEVQVTKLEDTFKYFVEFIIPLL